MRIGRKDYCCFCDYRQPRPIGHLGLQYADMMLIPKNKPLRNEKYLAYLKTQPCESCGLPDHSDPAHVNAGHEGGWGMKGPDSLAVSLCRRCHMDQEDNPGAGWWFENVFKQMRRDKYQEWKDAQT